MWSGEHDIQAQECDRWAQESDRWAQESDRWAQKSDRWAQVCDRWVQECDMWAHGKWVLVLYTRARDTLAQVPCIQAHDKQAQGLCTLVHGK